VRWFGLSDATVMTILEERLRRVALTATPLPEASERGAFGDRAVENFDYLLISRSVAEDLSRMQAIVEAEQMKAARSQHRSFSPVLIVILLLLLISGGMGLRLRLRVGLR